MESCPTKSRAAYYPAASVCNTWYNNERSSLYLGGFILQASFYVALFLSFASAAGAGDSAFEATAIIDDYVAASQAQKDRLQGASLEIAIQAEVPKLHK